MPSEAKTRPAILPMHSQNYSSLRKRSYKKACRRATEAQQPVAYRGQQLTQLQVRRSCRFYPASSITFVILCTCINLPTALLKSPRIKGRTGSTNRCK